MLSTHSSSDHLSSLSNSKKKYFSVSASQKLSILSFFSGSAAVTSSIAEFPYVVDVAALMARNMRQPASRQWGEPVMRYM